MNINPATFFLRRFCGWSPFETSMHEKKKKKKREQELLLK